MKPTSRLRAPPALAGETLRRESGGMEVWVGEGVTVGDGVGVEVAVGKGVVVEV